VRCFDKQFYCQAGKTEPGDPTHHASFLPRSVRLDAAVPPVVRR
jgi:hypothetical protein